MLFCCTDKEKHNDFEVQIQEIIVYLDFQERGYTTAGAYTHFDDLERDGINTIVLSKNEVKKIESVLAHASPKKHKQTKLGVNLVFCKVKYTDRANDYSRVVISIGQERILVSDLSRMVDFEIVEMSKKQKILDIINRLKQE